MEKTTPKHTPGPWKWAGAMNGTILSVFPESHTREQESLAMNGIGRIARIEGTQAGIIEATEPTEATANANLIAAAPDLLVALEDLVNSPIVEGMSARIRDYASQNGQEDPYAKAVAILAKAKGEAK